MLAGNVTFNPSSYESIATVTVGSGGASTITFSSIPSNYLHLQVRALTVSVATYVDMQFNGDTAANYSYHQIETSGTTVTTGGSGTMQQIYAGQLAGNSSFPGISIIDFYEYSSTTKNKTVRSINGVTGTSGGNLYFRSGVWFNTTAINSILFRAQPSSTFAQNTVYALYGIRGA